MEIILPVFVFLLGAVLASFALVVAERLNTGESWHRGRSRCNSCARELGARDLVPIASYVLSLGRCRGCGSSVPGGYLASEILLGALFLAAYFHTGLTPALGLLLIALTLLLALVWYDLRHMVIPSAFQIPLLLASLAYAVLSFPQPAVLGGVLFTAGCIGMFFFLFHALSRGRAMGLGDAPLALSLSLLAGPLALSGLVYSFWVGGVVGIVMLSARLPGTRMNSEVPFAPFLAAGFLIALFTTWDLLSILGLPALTAVLR